MYIHVDILILILILATYLILKEIFMKRENNLELEEKISFSSE